MNTIELLRRLHQHRQWTNSQLLEAAGRLTQDQLNQRFAIGQGSIWQSLTHLYAAEFVWLEGLLGNENPLTPGDATGKLPGNQEGDHPIVDLQELRSRWTDLDGRWNAYLAQLNVESLQDMVTKTSSLSGKPAQTQRSDILLHVCTHAQYTTAQVMNMLRHVGVVDLPDPMLITMARQEAI